MKLAVFADLHLDTPFRWAGPEAARRRRQGLRQVLERIAEMAVDEADALLCAGDLYEQECFGADTGEFLRATFAAIAPLPVLVAPGNHDWFGPASLYQRVEWSPNVRVFGGGTLEPYELSDGFTIWGVAHRAPRGTGDFLQGFKVDRGGVNLALFHGSERGVLPYQEDGKEAHAPFDAREVGAAGLDHALVGHYHRPNDGALHTYPGNPEPLSFGEPEPAGGLVVADVAGNGVVEITRRLVAVTEMHDLEIDVTGCRSTKEVRDRVANDVCGLTGMARVTLSGELDPDVDLHESDLRDVRNGLDGLVIRFGHLHVAYEVDAIAAEATVQGQFVRDVIHSDLDETEKQRVIATGLRALAGRADLEVA